MSPSTDPGPNTPHKEAAGSAVRHTGPTADRYQDAVLRYLEAMATDRSAAALHGAHRKPPATLVGDVMKTAVVAAHEGAVFKEIVAALARNRIRSVPVIDDNRKVVGVVSASDLLTRVVAGPGARAHGRRRSQKPLAASAGELMSAPPVTIRAHATIVEAARRAAQAGVRMLPVVNGTGGLIGIVTQGDLLRVFLRDDSEIREEIERFAVNSMHLEPAQITVEVRDGVVSLSGKLDRELQVTRIITHVRAVPGVVDIDNHLTARFDDRYFPAPHEAGGTLHASG